MSPVRLRWNAIGEAGTRFYRRSIAAIRRPHFVFAADLRRTRLRARRNGNGRRWRRGVQQRMNEHVILASPADSVRLRRPSFEAAYATHALLRRSRCRGAPG